MKSDSDEEDIMEQGTATHTDPMDVSAEVMHALELRGYESGGILENGEGKTKFVGPDGIVHAKQSGVHVTLVFMRTQGTIGHVSPVADGSLDEQVGRWLNRVTQ